MAVRLTCVDNASGHDGLRWRMGDTPEAVDVVVGETAPGVGELAVADPITPEACFSVAAYAGSEESEAASVCAATAETLPDWAEWLSLTDFSYSSSLDISAQVNNPSSMYLAQNNKWLYVIDGSDQTAYQYDVSSGLLGAAFVASYTFAEFASGEPGIWISGNGLLMLVIESRSNAIYKYELSIPYMIYSATYSGHSLSLIDRIWLSIFATNAGDKIMITERERLWLYTLSEPFDLSTASLEPGATTFPGSGSVNLRTSINPSGNQILLGDNTNDAIRLYQLSGNFAHGSMTLLDTLVTTAQATVPTQAFITPAGDKLYIADNLGARILEYQKP